MKKRCLEGTLLKSWRKPSCRIGFFISFFIVVSVLSPVVYAQTEEPAYIVQSTGSDFNLVRKDGSHGAYGPAYVSSSPIALKNSDYIQTPPGVFVEVMLIPGKASVIIAENTSVVFDNIENSGGHMIISLTYGRIRISQRRSSSRIFVRAGPSVTEIQNGSINMDLVVPPESLDSQLALYVSTLSGTAVFMPSAASPETEQIKMRPHQTIIFNTYSNEVNRQSMNKNIVNYWADRIGRGNRNIPSRRLDPANVSNPEAMFARPNTEYAGMAASLKTRFLIVGVISILAGAALQGAVYFTSDSWTTDAANYAFLGAYVPFGVGTFMLLSAYFY
jgi:hypothetical protein